MSTCVLACLAAVASWSRAKASGSIASQKSRDGVWEELSPQALRQISGKRPEKFRALRLNAASLERALAGAPRERVGRAISSDVVVSLPLPDGRFAGFEIEESPVIAPELATQFPDIKSYRGRSPDDPAMQVRLDWTARGLHALISSGNEVFSVQPASLDDTSQYLSYAASDLQDEADDFICNVSDPDGSIRGAANGSATAKTATISAAITGPQLRVYRIAIATTQEYTNAAALGGGSVSSTIASINTWLNSINLIYEKELAIRFVLIANNTSIIYTSEPDPFTNGDTSSLINEGRVAINNQIGASNYDVGHVLGTTGSGAQGQAYLQTACWNEYKGGGATVIAQSGPVGSTGYVGVLIHEFGHQLGADHSFNASCSNNRNGAAAWESGSGLTVMSYAGQCSPDFIVSSRLFAFHSGSISQISSYFNSSGSCAVQSATGNSAPVANGGADYTIPRSTPFALTGTATDADPQDNANLAYSWEQIDAGGATYLSPPYTDAADSSATTRPIFRPFPSSTSPIRIFPSLTYILGNANVPPATVAGLQTAENLPAVGRTLNFNLVVRDNRGGTSLDPVRLTVAGTAGPFLVTSPNTAQSWEIGSQQTVTWSVNGTSSVPVNCSQVRISLSIDGGQTFPVILASSTPNDGSETITVPANASTTARIKVEAVGNIFFDISDTNFSVVPAGSCPAATGLVPTIGYTGSLVDISGINLSGVSSVRFGGGVSASYSVVSSSRVTATVPAGASTGPIRLSKSGCSDAVTSTFTLSSSPPVSLAVDDGSFEGAYTAGGWAVNRLTPLSYPATLATVSLYFASFSNVQPGMSITLLVGTNTDGDTTINGTNFQTLATTVQSVGQWNVYNVPTVTINSGDFVVGFRYTPVSGVYPVHYDRTSSLGRSYASSDGTIFVLQDSLGSTFAGNAGIRASVFLGPLESVPPASVRVNSTIIQRGQNGNVTVDLVANGGANGENTVAFSVGFDPTQLQFVSVVPGSSGAPVTANTSQSNSGLLGLTIAKPSGTAFPPGTNQIAVMTFLAVSSGTQNSTAMVTGDSPVVRGLFSTSSESLAVSWNSGTITISAPTILDGDVAPRPNGNGVISVADWVQVGRFSAGLDVPSPGGEFQRADCAPKATLGDGKITVADWVQAGRYSVGLDAPVEVGGPTSAQGTDFASSSRFQQQTALSHRALRVRSDVLKRGEAALVPIEFDAAGDESALAFSVSFDPQFLSFVDSVTDNTDLARVIINSRDRSAGHIGVALALPPGQTLTPGLHRLLYLKLLPTGGGERVVSEISLDNSVVEREVVNADAAQVNGVRYEPATVTIEGSSIAVVSAASFSSSDVAAGGIVAAFGKELSPATAVASSTPLPDRLAGTFVIVRDSAGVSREAPLFYVSPGQINFLIPEASSPGPGQVTINSADGRRQSGAIDIREVAAGLFTSERFAVGNTFSIGDDGIGRYEPLLELDPSRGFLVPRPITVSGGGIYLVLYATGLHDLKSPGAVVVRVDGIEIVPQYVGPHGTLIGVDQINLLLPAELTGRGEVRIEVEVEGTRGNSPAVVVK